MVFNLMIGLVTPPVGSVLYTLNRVTGLSLERLYVAMLPGTSPWPSPWRSSSSSPAFSVSLPGAILGTSRPVWVARGRCWHMSRRSMRTPGTENIGMHRGGWEWRQERRCRGCSRGRELSRAGLLLLPRECGVRPAGQGCQVHLQGSSGRQPPRPAACAARLSSSISNQQFATNSTGPRDRPSPAWGLVETGRPCSGAAAPGGRVAP